MSQERDKYDFAFPLGAACAASIALRAANLQFTSTPFDWIGGGTVLGRARLLADGFKDWMRIEDMELTDVISATFNSSIYRNRVTGLVYSHDFPAACYLEDELPGIVAKYDRRIRRLFEEVSRAKKVLVVYNEIPYRPVASDADIVEARRVLQARFPESCVDLLYFAQDPDCVDREPAALDEHVTKVLLDYHSIEHGYVSVAALYHKMVQFLRSRYEVPDPRTPEQIARFKAQSAERAGNRWGTGFRYWLNKRAYRLYRHLERYLARQKCIPSMERPLKLYAERGERRRSLKEPDISSLPRDEAASKAMYGLL